MKKKATMQLIADELNISKSLVSKALSNAHGVSEETKRKVILTANQLGYKTNSSVMKVTSSKTGTVALLVTKEDMTDLEYWGKVINGIEDELSKNFFSLILSAIDTVQPTSKGIPSCISERKVDGAIIMGRVKSTFVHAIHLTGIPVILVDSDNVDKLRLDHVLADNFGGGVEAATYLIQNNHRSIGFVGDTSYSLSFRERYRGFTQAVSDYNHDVDGEKVICTHVTDKLEDEQIPFSTTQFEHVLKSDHVPSALFCANDPTAFTVLGMMNKYGLRCPEDISIISFDNIDKCNWTNPRLTSIDACKQTMGRRAVEMLLRRMEQRDLRPECIMMTTQIYERDSVIPQ